MVSTIITDTGFWLALRNPRDTYHGNALQCMEKYGRRRYVTTWPVMSETYYLLLTRMGPDDAIAFMEAYRRQTFDVLDLTPEHTPRIIELCNKYRDLPMDLADVSLVILAEQLDHGDIFSTDSRDFESYRWKQQKPLNNLMLDV